MSKPIENIASENPVINTEKVFERFRKNQRWEQAARAWWRWMRAFSCGVALTALQR